MCLNTLKPIHAHWMLVAFEKIRDDMSLKLIGWQRTGIENAVESALCMNE